MATCRGVDVSAYQPVQDWGAHKRNGVQFAWAKATEGQHSRDPRFTTHISGIIASGLISGSYHFAWPNQNVGTEAANYIGAVRQYAAGHDYVHWLDLERYSDGRNYAGRSAAQILAWVKQWIAVVEDAFPGQRVGVYTSADDIAKGHVPAGVPLWYPAYPGASVDTYAEAEARPQPKPSGRAPLIWQFTSTPASGPRMDLNIAYMSAAQLRAWAAGDEETDMPLTDADVKKLADALVPKVAAAVYDKLVSTDNVLKAPPDASDYATNKFWTFGSHVEAATVASRKAATNTAAILKLLQALDPAALEAALVAKLDGLKTTVTVTKPEA
ncbi:glycoside hydrolase family 25 protein [Streptomyces sp. NPDC055722]